MKSQPTLVATDSIASVSLHPPRLIQAAGFNLAPMFILLSVGLGILCSRLFSIDVIIRRTLVYAMLTAWVGVCRLHRGQSDTPGSSDRGFGIGDRGLDPDDRRAVQPRA
jgi:hypothetical protein